MTKVNEDIFKNFCLISQKAQNIQKKIKQEEITPKLRLQLHKELESLQDNLATLQESAKETQESVFFQFSQLEEMDRQIVSLYRHVEEGFENYEISLISKEALEISENLESGKMLRVANQVNELRSNIHYLFQHRRPSLRQRKIIMLALKLADQANATLDTKEPASKEQLQLIQLLKTLLREAIEQVNVAVEVSEGDLAVELYEIADLYMHRKHTQATLRLQLIRSGLSKAQLKRLDAAKSEEEKATVLLEIASGDSCLEWEAKNFTFIHSLQA